MRLVTCGVQPDAVLPRVVAVGTARLDDRATRVALTPVDVETPLRVVGEDVVAHPVQRVAALDRVVLAEHVSEVGGVEIHVVTREQVLLGRQCAGDVRVAGRSRVLRRHARQAAVIRAGVVHEVRHLVLAVAVALVVDVLVAIPGGEEQLRRRQVVGAERRGIRRNIAALFREISRRRCSPWGRWWSAGRWSSADSRNKTRSTAASGTGSSRDGPCRDDGARWTRSPWASRHPGC